MIGVKPAPKPEPEDGADGAEPKGEDGEEKEQEKPRGNGTMWALFPGGYQVLHYALAPRALPGSLTFSGFLSPCSSTYLLRLPPFPCKQSPLRPKTAQEFEEQGYRRAHEGVHIMRDKALFEAKR